MGAICLNLNSHLCPSGCRTKPVRRGFYFRESDRRRIQRFYCTTCRTSYSTAYFDLCYRQKKRHINPFIFKLLVGGYSQRRTAMDLKLNRKTVVKKFIWLGGWAKTIVEQKNKLEPLAQIVEFDDLETSEHTKLKPLSVTIAVQHKTRRILGFEVSNMPAKGALATLSRAKYGKRADERPKGREKLFEKIRPLIAKEAIIKSDENPHYPRDVAKHFPHSKHFTYKGRRGCVVGQGELKKIGFDPLFSLNHTCAMLRDNIKRLSRKTWCTTKKRERLELNIALYALNHNLVLIQDRKRKKRESKNV